jgi:phage host-nuclease inhibitor protein Gam
MKTKTKSISTANYTRDQIDDLLAQYGDAERELKSLHALLDDDLAHVRATYGEVIGQHTARLAELGQQILSWAEANRAREFGKKKSLALLHGVLSFRTGQPSLKCLRGWTWKSVLTELVDIGSGYLRRTYAIDKEKILAAKLPAETLERLGLRIHQSETFEIKPTTTKIDQPKAA